MVTLYHTCKGPELYFVFSGTVCYNIQGKRDHLAFPVITIVFKCLKNIPVTNTQCFVYSSHKCFSYPVLCLFPIVSGIDIIES